ncbi:MAG: exo-alpha-sialidase [Clostridia bacterium]|nr:exo-alpha-sialidase [Clostridia bacterium]
MAIQLFDRVLVDSAPRRVRQWGPYQFPSLCKKDGKYYYHFNDAADHYSAYGQPGWVYRTDAACLGWEWCDDRDAYNEARALTLPNGDRVCRYSIQSALTKDLVLPPSVGEFTINGRHYTCYRSDELPLDIGGFSLLRKKAGESEWKLEHVPMHENGGIRGAFDGFLPAMQARANKFWLGPDGKPYLLCYNFKLREDGTPDDRDWVYLMRSDDNAHSFQEIGAIPYQPDLSVDPDAYSDDRRGFLEPDMCFLDEKRILCVIRTTHRCLGPMYICRSSDGGATWTKPEYLHNHGVYPHLLRLECGAVVLSYGRPGVDVMVSWDEGETWSKPVCIVPQKNPKPTADTCGYTQLIAVDRNTCMLAFSDFNYDPGDGYPRKAMFSQLIRLTKEEKN